MSASPSLQTPLVSCFSLVASADPGVFARVINVFAKRGLIPDQVYSTRVGPRGEDLHINLQVAEYVSWCVYRLVARADVRSYSRIEPCVRSVAGLA